MSDDRIFVIVGAGHAGGRAAQAMRQAGFEGRVVLIGEEAYPPYERPPLSKELLVGEDGIEKAQLLTPGWYEENGVELRLGAHATAIDRKARTVTLKDGETIGYDKLLLTTGARVRRLDIPGADLDGVFYIRDFDDTRTLRERLSAGTRVVVVGGGFIGLETAASALKRGAEVTVLEAADRLMGRSLAPEVSAWFADMHRRRGIDVRLSAGIAAIEGSTRVERVRLRDDETLDCDLVVIGIGILPNIELAEQAGLMIDNGIVVDEHCRTTDPDIYAAGDVVNQPNRFTDRRLRLESYQNAQDQSAAAARNMCGEDVVYEDSLWVWSDQHDVNLQMTGVPAEWDQLVWRGDVEGESFAVFYLLDGRVVAVNTVNDGREMRPAQRLMQTGKRFEPEQLADPEVKLLKLAKA